MCVCNDTIRYAELFAGVGGIRLGLEQAAESCGVDAECVFASEIDKFAQQTYTKNFGDAELHGDITTIDASTIPDIDVLVGGFPCQAFSIAGRRRGFDDTRGTLFFEVARIAREKKPKIILLENVKGLLNHDKGNTFRVILSTLDQLGYDVEWQVLNSKNFGVPQNRERVFIIGHLRGISGRQIFPIRKDENSVIRSPGVKEAGTAVSECLTQSMHKVHLDGTFVIHGNRKDRIMDDMCPTLCKQMGTGGHNVPLVTAHSLYPRSSKSGKGGTGQLSRDDGLSYCLDTGNTQAIEIRPCLTPDRINKRQNGRRFKEPGDPAFTVTAHDRHGVLVGDQIRRLTPIECERLQGFPDNWTDGVSMTQRYKQMGNAVTVNVIKAIFEKIFDKPSSDE